MILVPVFLKIIFNRLSDNWKTKNDIDSGSINNLIEKRELINYLFRTKKFQEKYQIFCFSN